MQSPTHTLLALALLSKKSSPRRNLAIFIGSIVPDAFIYLAWVWLTARGTPQKTIWNDIYFDDPMQMWGAIFNSAPLYAMLAGIGAIVMRKYRTFGMALMFFALAALIHLATDLPVHNDDAHRHFWPLSDWRFISPVSYWDSDHHGFLGSLIGATIALASIAVLWRRFHTEWARIWLGIFAALYVGTIIVRLLFKAGILGN